MDPSENPIDSSENTIDNVSSGAFCVRGMCTANPEDNEHVSLEMREMDSDLTEEVTPPRDISLIEFYNTIRRHIVLQEPSRRLS